MIISFPNAVTTDGGGTVTAQLTVRDATFTVTDDVDTTKAFQFQVSGLTTGTTRTLTVPDVTGTLAALNLAQTFTAVQTFSAQPVFSAAGGISLSAAVSVIVPGATSLSLRNNANSADNLILTDAGLATFRNTVTVSSGDITASSGNLLASSLGSQLSLTRTSVGTWTARVGGSSELIFDGPGSVDSVVFPSAGGMTIVGTVALGSSNLTMTGTISATGARITKSWHTDITSTNAVTVDSSLLSKVPESVTDYTGDALAVLRAARVVSYRHHDYLDPSNRTKLGVVAETLAEPLALNEIDNPLGGTYPGVNMMALLALQTRAIQQLERELAALRAGSTVGRA